MRWLSGLLLALGICLIAIALPSLPAQAICVPYDIEVIPSWGPPGTQITLYGHDFDADKPVDIYYDGTLVTEGIQTSPSGEFTTFLTIPEDCTGQYEVHAVVGSDLGPVERHHYFTVKPGLTISPEQGPVGTNVTVKGRGFTKNEQGIELVYYITDSPQTVERNIVANAKGSWEKSFQIRASTRGEHKLDAWGTVSKHYEVKDATFRVTAEVSIDKSSGIVGDTVTMSGSRFGAYEKDIKILFDGEAAVTDIEANPNGEWQASFEVPEMPGGEYAVTADGDQTSKEDLIELSFEIKPAIVLSAYGGHIGMDLTVSGHGFAAKEDVVTLYDDSQVAIVETDDKGSFQVGFSAPESKYGEHRVAAGYSGGNAATAIFTMESNPPPVPQLISPPDRSRMGFMGEVTPTFEWSEVSDDSGVRYSLQVATSDNVTATGEFADPLVSVAALGEMSYTLEEKDALPHGTYYWIVRAVDGAENEGEWSAVHSFRVGLLPRWGFIVIIVAIAVGIGVLIRALIRRRAIYYDRW